MADLRPVGVFDSGVGGLTILSELRRQSPDESLVFIADQAWAPYGDRTLGEVRARAFAVVEHLLDGGVKAVVVACNTASAAALHELRAAYPAVPFVGMEPAVKPAAEQSDRGVVGVLATAATFQGELYASVVDRHANSITVVDRPGRGLVELIEAGVVEGPEMDECLRGHLVPMMEAGIDTLVLGCTHYPFVADRISSILGDRVRLIDPAPAVARQTGRVLAAGGLAAGEGEAASTAYRTTGDAGHLRRQLGVLLDLDVPVQHVEVG
jgi:glutamate racemase